MKLSKILKRNSFLRHNIVFFLGSVVVGVLNYAYYPVLGRMMSPGSFGEIQVLVSLFLQFTIFLNVLGMITVNITTNYSNTQKAHRIIFELEKLAAYGALAIVAVTIFAGDFLRAQLQFDSSMPFFALALALLVSIPLTFRTSFIRGKKAFGIASLSQLIGAFIKVAFSALLVALGLGVTGAMFGIVAAQIAAFLYAARWAARLGFDRPADTHYGTLPNLKVVASEIKYAGVVFVGLLSITLLMSIDVIVVKYFFDAHTAGLYAGIAAVARIVFFFAVPLSQVLMPMVKQSRPQSENMILLGKSVALTVLICGPVVGLCWLFPGTVITLLMGASYVQYAELLPVLALVVFIISLVNLVFMYYLTLRQKTVTLIGIIGFVVSLSIMIMWHDTLHAIVYGLLFTSCFTLFATGVYVLVNLKRGDRNAQQNDLDRHSDI
jgi:O-antigen/teichoic acid export membrane protein